MGLPWIEYNDLAPYGVGTLDKKAGRLSVIFSHEKLLRRGFAVWTEMRNVNRS